MARRWSALLVGIVLILGQAGTALAGARGPSSDEALTAARIQKGLVDKLDSGALDAFVVEFSGSANLAGAKKLKDKAARGAAVVKALKGVAARDQKAAIAAVAKTKGARATSFWLGNLLLVEGGTAKLAEQLSALDGVVSVREQKRYPLVKPVEAKAAVLAAAGDPEWGVAKIRADEVWADGITGQGVVVANIDTGVDYLHPALVEHYRGNNHDGTFSHDFNWWDPTGICGDEPCDNAAHGTHTMGTIVGGDGPGPFTPDIGVAPGAEWIAAKGCEDFFCTDTSLASSGQFMLAPTDLDGLNPTPALAPHVINNSWGGGPGDPFYLDIVQAWRAAGIIPVFASGNPGPFCGEGGSPGDYLESFSAGATDMDDVIADFSGRGPSAFGKINPDVSAPGVDVVSSVPGGDYEAFSGTSMATPHTVGTLALVLSAEAALIGDVDGATLAVRNTALDRLDDSCGGEEDGDPNNVYGDGRIDAKAAADLVATGGTLAGTVTDSATAAPIPGARITASDGTRDFSTVTDAAGNYDLFLAAGDYTVAASAFGYAGQITGPVTIQTDLTTDQDFALVALPRFTVSGVITAAEDGSPIAGARVKALGTPVPSAVSGPTGAYSLELPIGEFTLRASAGGCTETATAGISSSGPDITQDFSLFRKIDDFGHGCESIAFDWVDAPLQSALYGDEFAGRLRLPFDFPFYGETYSQVFISDNGYLNFLAPEQFNNFPFEIPSESPPNAAIYPLWQDLYLDAGSGIDYATVGDAFVIEFSGLKARGATGRVSFEVKLHSNGDIDLLYGDSPANPGDGRNAVVGIENKDGTDALQMLAFEGILESNSAFRITTVPSGLVSGTVTDLNDGLPIEGAAVTAVPGGRTATTNAAGEYSLRLRPGSYTVTASKTFYTSVGAAAVVVDGGSLDLDFALPAAKAAVDPTAVSASVEYGSTTTANVRLSNPGGSATLLWGARERNLGVEPLPFPSLAGVQGTYRPGWQAPTIVGRLPSVARSPALAPEDLSTIINDPAGDSVGSVDVTTVRGGSDGIALMAMALDFTAGTPISQAVGEIYVDTDQDPGTGIPPEFFFGLPTQDIGAEYIISLFAIHEPEPVVLVFDTERFDLTGIGPAEIVGQTVSFELPLEAFGGDDGFMDVAMVLGDFFQPTDWAPDVGHGTIEPFTDVPWLSETPEGGEIAPDASQDVTLNLGTPTLGPGIYHALVVFVTNAPKQQQVPVDVTLTVTRPDTFGDVSGTVTDAHTGAPIPGATVAVHAEWNGSPLDLVATTGADGTWVVSGPDGTWPTDFTADGYVPFSQPVTIVEDVLTTGADAALHLVQPHAALEGGPFTFVLTPGRQGDGTLTLSNPDGHAPLDFSVGEVDLGGGAPVAGVETWLTAGPARASGARANRAGATPSPRAYRWLPSPTDTASVLVYADDVIHTAPDTLVDQALQRLGIGYVAHYDGDWGGFEDDLSSGTWDMVIVAADNFGADVSTLDALEAYVSGGGRLLYHNWAVLFEPDHPLMAALGVQFASNDDDPPDPVFWWQPGHPAVLVPQDVPELTALDGGLFGFSYGQHVEPLAGTDTVGGFTTPGPDPNEAALVIGATGNTVFKGFTDSQNSADLDEDGLLDGSELWENLIFGIQNGFLSDAPWLTVAPVAGTVAPDGSATIDVSVDSTGLTPGVYNALVVVRTNDPDNRSFRVPVTLVVPGYQQGVNAGGGAYTNANGDVYAADRIFSAGSFGYLGASSTRSTGAPIAGTTEDPLYQDLRSGMSEYRFDGLAAGTYRIDLHFAELQLGRAGGRVFSVAIEGAGVLANFDVFAAAGGKNTALDRSFLVDVTDGTLDIVFTAQRGDTPIVNAILVTHLPEGSPGL